MEAQNNIKSNAPHAAATGVSAHISLETVKHPIDESLYSITAEESTFFRRHTGITDEDELRKHILTVQAKAYDIFGYPCICGFFFMRCIMSRNPVYHKVMALPKERKGAIFLDIGCCFGNDIRMAVDDGWPVEDAIASDLEQAFWDMGHELFKSNSQSFSAVFIVGDAFKSITPHDPFYLEPENPRPSLYALTSLKLLQGHVSAIHASRLFHLFNEEKQLELARLLATLLSPAPGSIIFGLHTGEYKQGIRTEVYENGRVDIFCHSPESWQDLWDGQVFTKGSVRVDARLRGEDRPDMYYQTPENGSYTVFDWSVTRLSVG